MAYVAKAEKNRVKIYKSNGSYVRTIMPGGEVQSAVINGDEVHITLKNGRVKIYGVNGSYKRTIF